MEIKEIIDFRDYLLEESKDENGFISDSSFLRICLPGLIETKLIDSDECNETFCSLDKDQIKIDGYLINESGERLQVFLLNEDSLDLRKSPDQLAISQKSFYEKQFTRAINFVRKGIKRQLDDLVQDSSPAKPLISYLGSAGAMDEIDVVEVFLISATATIESRGNQPSTKQFEFEDDGIKLAYLRGKEKVNKEIIIIKRLIDLNFLYNVEISQGNREVLKIDFTNPPFNYRINCIQAANESNFESFLCVLPGTLLAELYKRFSSRMLEKNVRSFLQLKGVNKGIQETIKKNPEKFIAYNNGLTITATGKELIEENGKLFIKSLSDFQIVNGGQTTATIYFSKKAGISVNNIHVMAKINVAKDATMEELDDLISNISTFSNAQSKVSKVDLRSRNNQLVKLKSLSESVLTPSSKKWFFERAKGEFNTLLRKSPQQKSKINREFPKERRFTKEELAKYYCSWGQNPYLVKKGGEKIFRLFIEDITGENKKNIIEIDRAFYENLIARIILFRTLENIYGAGANAIGQIRSAVVPYSISILYSYTSGRISEGQFDLYKIWKTEALEEDLQVFFKSLMTLMNDLIKKYSASDDYGEYSKKEELWNKIIACQEISSFIGDPDSKKILEKYAVSKDALKKRNSKKPPTVDFEPLADMVSIYSNSEKFYKKIAEEMDSLKEIDKFKLEQIISCIQQRNDITPVHISFEKNLIKEIRLNTPELFDKYIGEGDDLLKKTFDFILRKYNLAKEQNLDIKSEFAGIKDIAGKKGAKYYSVFDEIGKALMEGRLPSIKELYQASNYVSSLRSLSEV